MDSDMFRKAVYKYYDTTFRNVQGCGTCYAVLKRDPGLPFARVLKEALALRAERLRVTSSN
jgi:hypothetical protein